MSMYKYIVPDRTEIFKNSLIRFSQPSALNDPFEMKPFLEALAPEGYFEERLTNRRSEIIQMALLEKLLRKQYYELPAEIRSDLPPIDVIGPLLISPQIFPHIKRIIEQNFNAFLPLVPLLTKMQKKLFTEALIEAVETLGVLCLTPQPDNLIMRAHYAQYHQGFVLEFDKQHLFFHQRKFPEDDHSSLRKVIYVQARPLIPFLEQMTEDDLFFTKGKQWEYEEEWRMLRALNEADEVRANEATGDIYLFSFPPECLTGILFGSRMQEAKRKEIIKLLGENVAFAHVKRYQAILSEAQYSIEIVESPL